MSGSHTLVPDREVWRPGADETRRSRILEFARSAGCDGVTELRRRAAEDPVWYWQSVTEWLDLDWQVTPGGAVDQLDVPYQTNWFPGGHLNIADNAVDRWVRRGRGGEMAVSWELEDGTRGCYTFAQLAVEVDRVGHGLRKNGIGFGDRVGLQVPMIIEAVVAQLACAKIGAVVVPVFSGFGAGAVADRLRTAGAVGHIVAEEVVRRGRALSLRDQTTEALRAVSTVRVTIVVGRHGQAAQQLPGEVAWEDLGSASPGEELAAASCPSGHPLMIAFTSGTTGTPKGVVLGQAGFAIKAGSDAAFCFDIGRGDIASWVTDPGWIMSPITILGGLVAGSSVAVYAGAPDFPDAGRVWKFARDHGVTMLGVSPTLVRSLMGRETHGAVDRGDLRVLASSGEPWTPQAYSWFYEHVGGGQLPVINYSGGTEVSGAILSNTTAEPIHPCGFAGPVPGMGAAVADSEGGRLRVGKGELVLENPSPGMPLSFWGDPDKYRSTYWDRWDRTWVHGDWVEVDEEDVWFIRGRSDDTLKIAGKRLGPAEVEAVVNGVESVRESAAIGVPDPVKGEALVVFAMVADSKAAPQAMTELIRDRLTRTLGKPLAPSAIHLVTDLPRTRSGKILRRVLRAVYLGETPADASPVANPDSLDPLQGLR